MNIEAMARQIRRAGREGALLFAISGIDGSGKTTLSRQIVRQLEDKGFRCALVNLDVWHTAPEVRFSAGNPGEHFYNCAFRFEELFRLLIDPLRSHGGIHQTVELTRLPENDWYQYTYDFAQIDVILLEGIFLLKKDLRSKYDYSVWIDCPFETALQRAIVRNQEGLSRSEIIRDYETIYFPAQRVHFERDAPEKAADLVVQTDI